MDRDGVEIRPKSIRLFFVWEGRQRETLTMGGKPMKPTAGNIAHARRVAVEIRKAIGQETFVLADFFPDSPRAGAKSKAKATFGEFCAMWLATKGRLALKTRAQYRNACEVWKGLLGADKPIADMSHGYVAAKIGGHGFPLGSWERLPLFQAPFGATSRGFVPMNPLSWRFWLGQRHSHAYGMLLWLAGSLSAEHYVACVATILVGVPVVAMAEVWFADRKCS